MNTMIKLLTEYFCLFFVFFGGKDTLNDSQGLLTSIGVQGLLTLCFAFRDHWLCSGNHMGYRCLNPGLPCTGQLPYSLYYLFSPKGGLDLLPCHAWSLALPGATSELQSWNST